MGMKEPNLATHRRASRIAWILAVGVLAAVALICAGGVARIRLDSQRSQAEDRVVFQLNMVGDAVTTYYEQHGKLPPATFDYRPAVLRNDSGPILIHDVSWSASIRRFTSNRTGEGYMEVRLVGRDSAGRPLHDTYECLVHLSKTAPKARP